MAILDNVNSPQDIKLFNNAKLDILAKEIRDEVISIALERGGHLGASLGVVELTIALHYVFDTPEDLLVWDIGHQTYPHKILTGRRGGLKNVRKKDGISGFLKRNESVYDTFGAGHSSTSISAALGMAVANKINGKTSDIIAVIGDGSLSAGMAYEAINNTSLFEFSGKFIVILNDNKMSISPAIGGITRYLMKLLNSGSALKMRNIAKDFIKFMPDSFSRFVQQTEKCAKNIISGSNLFEELGMHYIGPIDGHNLECLISVLSGIKAAPHSKKPILLHVVTEKGRGFAGEKKCDEMYHTISPLSLAQKTDSISLSQICADTLTEIALNDEVVVAITAAMLSGTCLKSMHKVLENRVFDTGIAEQHSVTFAAGLATQNIKPFVAIYSTFLQRAYDQIVHDVAIQSLPVRFLIDRAGFTGEDGPTHAGLFDIAFLTNIPNFVVMAPSSADELSRMIFTAYLINDKPSAVRFPKMMVQNWRKKTLSELKPIEIGKSEVVLQGGEIVILAFGMILDRCIEAAAVVEKTKNLRITVVNARFTKPLDCDLLTKLCENHKLFFTVEEGVVGGFGSHVSKFLEGMGVEIEQICIPDRFIDHQSIEQAHKEAGIDTASIIARLIARL